MVAGMFWYQYEATGETIWKVRFDVCTELHASKSNSLHQRIHTRIEVLA